MQFKWIAIIGFILLAVVCVNVVVDDFIYRSYCSTKHYSLNIEYSKNVNMFICEYKIKDSLLKINDTISLQINEIFVEHSWAGDKNNDCKPKRSCSLDDEQTEFPECSQMIITGNSFDQLFIDFHGEVKIICKYEKIDPYNSSYGYFWGIGGNRIACRFPGTLLPDTMNLEVIIEGKKLSNYMKVHIGSYKIFKVASE